ncbi:MAG TPA: hypothetical protein VHB02_02490 [Acidimicrobiales bacterium]|nr:hypothetical protein [Acidimicrobiales bacterium]
MPIEVVVASSVLVAAFSEIGPVAVTFPAVPPLSGRRHADALGVFAYPDDHFALSASEATVEEVVTVLTGGVLAWSYEEAEAAVVALGQLAERSGGGLVTAEEDVEVPPGVGASTATAIRAVCAKDLGHPRVMVTEDPVALRFGKLHPAGIPFPPEEDVEIVDPARFARLAHQVRWRMRPAEDRSG